MRVWPLEEREAALARDEEKTETQTETVNYSEGRVLYAHPRSRQFRHQYNDDDDDDDFYGDDVDDYIDNDDIDDDDDAGTVSRGRPPWPRSTWTGSAW